MKIHKSYGYKKPQAFWKLLFLYPYSINTSPSLIRVQFEFKRSGQGSNTPDNNCQMCSASGRTCHYLSLRPCVSLVTSSDVTNPHSRTQTASPALLHKAATSLLNPKKQGREVRPQQVKSHSNPLSLWQKPTVTVGQQFERRTWQPYCQ